MSEQVFEGAVRVERYTGFGMVTLRGDQSDPAFAQAVGQVTGAVLPARREVSVGTTGMLAWMSPDELLAVVPASAAHKAAQDLIEALKDQHALAVDVSDARAVFRLSGPGVREVLAKGAPVDLSAQAFGPGQIRRTRLGQVAAAFWMSGDDQFDVVCFASVSDFVFDWLCTAARAGALPEFL